MRAFVIVCCAALAVGIESAAAAVTVGQIQVSQNWPWSNKVFVDYELNDTAGGVHDVTVTFMNGNQPVNVPFGALSGDLYGVGTGKHRIVWDPSHGDASGLEKLLPSLTAKVSVDEDEKMFMILDLTEGKDAATIPVSFASAPPSGGWNKTDYKTTKLVLRRIPASTFVMGMSAEDIAHFGNPPYSDAPAKVCVRHRTTLTKAYYIGVFPMTIGHAYRIDGYRGSYSPDTHATYPAFNMCYAYLRGTNSCVAANWPKLDNDSFLSRMNAKTTALATSLPGYGFELPTHAQWECACRAGTDTCWNNGTIWAEDGTAETDANLSPLGVYKSNSGSGPWSVAQKQPNAFGLFDMHGCLHERIRDRYDVYYQNHSGADEVDPLVYSDKTTWSPATWSCGGAWNSSAKGCQSGYMNNAGSLTDHTTDTVYGFRLACVYIGD